MRLAIALYVALTVSASAAAPPSIAGDWHEDETYSGMRTIALSHFRTDGTFTIEFRECKKDGVFDHTDTGHWAYASGDLRITTETQNGFWIYAVDDYKTMSYDGRLWVYKSVHGPGFDQYGQVTFHDVRVTSTSKMPGCDLTS